MVLGPHHPVFRRHPGDEPLSAGGGASGDEPVLPSELRADLKAIFGDAPGIPESIDRAVIDEGRYALARPRTRVLFTFRRVAAALATAAVLGLAVLIAVPTRPPQARPERSLALERTPAAGTGRGVPGAPVDRAAGPAVLGGGAGRDDAARDAAESAARRPAARRADPAVAFRAGSVTIVDALVVARAMGIDDAKTAFAFDVTGDGAVDQRDVDAVAALAVSLTANPARGRGGPG